MRLLQSKFKMVYNGIGLKGRFTPLLPKWYSRPEMRVLQNDCFYCSISIQSVNEPFCR